MCHFDMKNVNFPYRKLLVMRWRHILIRWYVMAYWRIMLSLMYIPKNKKIPKVIKSSGFFIYYSYGIVLNHILW